MHAPASRKQGLDHHTAYSVEACKDGLLSQAVVEERRHYFFLNIKGICADLTPNRGR